VYSNDEVARHLEKKMDQSGTLSGMAEFKKGEMYVFVSTGIANGAPSARIEVLTFEGVDARGVRFAPVTGSRSIGKEDAAEAVFWPNVDDAMDAIQSWPAFLKSADYYLYEWEQLISTFERIGGRKGGRSLVLTADQNWSELSAGEMSTISSLELAGDSISVMDSCSAIEACPIESLIVTERQLVDAEWLTIKRSNGLRSLVFQRTKVDSDLVQNLMGMGEVQRVGFYYCALGPDLRMDFCSNSSLTQLEFIACKLSEGARLITGVDSRIVELDLTNSRAETDFLRDTGSLPHLERLGLRRFSVNGSTVSRIGGSGRLRAIDLQRSGFGDGDLEHLSAFRSLEWLSLWGLDVTDSSIGVLSGFGTLRFLQLRHTRFSESGLRSIRDLLVGCRVFG
jgi:hypothetical protein